MGVASEERSCVRFSREKHGHTNQPQPMRPLFNGALLQAAARVLSASMSRPPGLDGHVFDKELAASKGDVDSKLLLRYSMSRVMATDSTGPPRR